MAKKKLNGAQKPVELDDDLADFMGKRSAPRTMILKKIWDYVKKHDLQDPKDKRTVIPDDRLEPILGSRPVSMFKMMSKINDHVL